VVTAVESDRRTARLVRENAGTLGFHKVEVVALPVARALGQHPRAPYDVVFADPPYPLDNAELELALAQLVANQWVAPGSVLVVERSARSVEPAWPEGLVRERTKDYGETVLWYVRAGAEDDA
jgi:16S rRNA (guanine966-N2)-methyltransferase